MAAALCTVSKSRNHPFAPKGLWILAGGVTTGTSWKDHPAPAGAADWAWSAAPAGAGRLYGYGSGGYTTG